MFIRYQPRFFTRQFTVIRNSSLKQFRQFSSVKTNFNTELLSTDELKKRCEDKKIDYDQAWIYAQTLASAFYRNPTSEIIQKQLSFLLTNEKAFEIFTKNIEKTNLAGSVKPKK